MLVSCFCTVALAVSASGFTTSRPTRSRLRWMMNGESKCQNQNLPLLPSIDVLLRVCVCVCVVFQDECFSVASKNKKLQREKKPLCPSHCCVIRLSFPTCNIGRNIINPADCRLMILLDCELRVASAFAETFCDGAALQSARWICKGMCRQAETSLSCCSAVFSRLYFPPQSTV